MAELNPFPGMNPWMEWYWQSVHTDYVHFCRHQVARQLPQDLYCNVEATVYVVSAEWARQTFRADAAVLASAIEADPPIEETSEFAVAVARPVRWRVPVEAPPQLHIEIRSVKGDLKLVTAVEVISPTNKLDPRARRQYEQKRRAYMEGLTNIVEIDLLRAGEPLIGPNVADLADALHTPYRANVTPAATGEDVDLEADYYPLPLRERLPRITVPLRLGDQPVVLDLQSPLDETYVEARYDLQIDYRLPPDPPLSPEDAAWAAEVIAARGVART